MADLLYHGIACNVTKVESDSTTENNSGMNTQWFLDKYTIKL